MIKHMRALVGAGLMLAGAGTAYAEDAKMSELRGDNRGDRVVGNPWVTRSAVLGRHGMAATSHPLASQVAIDILKKGGTAVDAAIAANAAIGLMEPTGSGIGGDLFAIVWDPKTKKLYGLNASGRAPMGQDLAALKARIGADADIIPNWGSLSVTVPGAVDGWFSLHEKFGKLDMAENLAPAIAYAREGFPVTQVVAYYMGRSKVAFEKLHTDGVIEEIDNYRKVYLVGGEARRKAISSKTRRLQTPMRCWRKAGVTPFIKANSRM